MIYLDNAATTLHKPPEVAEAVVKALNQMGNSARGAHEEALTASRTIFQARQAAADLFGCSQADHVVFTSNSTEALNMAISGLFEAGDHIISTDLEHNSVLRPLYRLEKQQAEVSFVEADRQGRICYEDFSRLIKENTKAIVCTHASNLTGNVLDLKRIGEIAHKAGLLLIVDASQTAGVFPIHMEEMHIDVLCFTGHKSLFGPQGTGGLCVRPGLSIRPLKVGGSGIHTYDREHPSQMPTALEAGTLNGHGIAGLLAGITFIQKTGMDVIRKKEQALMERFYRGISAIEGVKIYGDFSDMDRAPVVCCNVRDYDSSEVSDELSCSYQIATRPGAHCAPRMHQALGTVDQGAVRFSFSWYNTEEEVDAAIAAMREIAEENE